MEVIKVTSSCPGPDFRFSVSGLAAQSSLALAYTLGPEVELPLLPSSVQCCHSRSAGLCVRSYFYFTDINFCGLWKGVLVLSYYIVGLAKFIPIQKCIQDLFDLYYDCLNLARHQMSKNEVTGCLVTLSPQKECAALDRCPVHDSVGK